jgi:modulator of FtsH protease
MTTYAIGSDTYLQRVYAWFTLGMVLFATTSFLSVTTGDPVSVTLSGGTIETVPPTVALVVQSPVIFSLGFIAFALCASIFRKSKSAGVPLFVGFTSLSGIFVGPSIYFAQMQANMGGTLSANPVRDAGILTVVAFASLSLYAMKSKRDFSAWGAFLSTGLWVLIGAMILNIFVGSSALDLAISSAAVLVFSGFIIYDTKGILEKRNGEDALGDALNLFLDALNLFLHLLRILSSSKSSD